MSLLDVNERPGEYPQSYYAATRTLLDDFPPLDGDLSCDVAIVGAGYTGLSAALHLAERGVDVVLIDAQRVGWGASGRNGGQIGSGQRVDQQTLEQMVGMDHAKKLWALAEQSKALVKDLVAAHQIDCDLKPGIIYADHKQRFVNDTRAYVEHLQKAYGYDKISFLNRDELREHLGTDAYYGASLDWGAGHLQPLNFALGLARAARDADVRILEMTRAEKIEPGAPARIKTDRGTVTSDHVLLACNGYLGDLQHEVASHVMPINSYIVATEPLSDDLARDLIRDDVAVADSRFVVNYYRLSADRRMLFGGRESYGYRYPADIATAVKKRMCGIYPQLENTRIDYAWGGTLGITMNRMPHLARLEPNVLSASGYSGHGLAMATLCGKLMADVVLGDAAGFDAMAEVPTPGFPGGTALRRPLLVLAMLYFALRDRL